MSTTENISYGTSTAITCTLASLASSSSAGRSCAAIDNTSNKYIDVLLTIAVKTSSSAMGADKGGYIWIYGSEDGSNYNGSSSEGEGTDAAVTLDSPSNLRGPVFLSTPASSTTYKAVISIAQFFGGVMPRKWGFVYQNNNNQNLDSTEGNHQKTYTGITETFG